MIPSGIFQTVAKPTEPSSCASWDGPRLHRKHQARRCGVALQRVAQPQAPADSLAAARGRSQLRPWIQQRCACNDCFSSHASSSLWRSDAKSGRILKKNANGRKRSQPCASGGVGRSLQP
eukprot:6181378-Pleurochrysis_carterae.AAC.3